MPCPRGRKSLHAEIELPLIVALPSGASAAENASGGLLELGKGKSVDVQGESLSESKDGRRKRGRRSTRRLPSHDCFEDGRFPGALTSDDDNGREEIPQTR